MKMLSKTLIGTLMLATTLPVATVPAFAQSRGEVVRSERDVRQEQRELQRERRDVQDARRYGNARDVREERRDVREQRRDVQEARREYREDLRDYRHYRGTNRQAFRGQNFRANFRYQQFRPGVRIAPNYFGQRYVVNNYRNYRLPNPGARQAWVRHYNDMLLVNQRNGTVIRVIPNFYW
ncbi:RcnB family protein [Blastomonas fulva]|uniref:RcnB family protein n=1 Tax=Blastomonas fulva TaxID=1550728 RepID=UPI003F7145F8